MSATATVPTGEVLAALLEDEKFERWVIDGELRERPMTRRSPSHAGAITALAALLGQWGQTRPMPAPRGFSAGIYFRFRKDPEGSVGVNIAVPPAVQAATVTPNLRFLDGPPILAVEVLSASDVHEDVHEKLEAYLDA